MPRATGRLFPLPGLAALLTCLLTGLAVADSGTFACFSLDQARRQIEAGAGNDELVTWLGYITDPLAIVVHPESCELVLVGRRDPERPPLHLDDLVVSLRSTGAEGVLDAPGVSLETVSGEGGVLRILVRYFGGIRDTHFGQICFEADYLLKEIGMGLEPTGSPHVPPPPLLEKIAARKRDDDEPPRSFRQFFFPAVARALRADHAVVLDECRIAVHSVPIGAQTGAELTEADHPEQRFSVALSEHYDAVARTHPVLFSLKALMSLVVLARGLEDLAHRPDLDYWLNEYRLALHETPRALDVVSGGEVGVVYSQSRFGDLRLRALTARVVAGDPYALPRAVFGAKPEDDALSWILRIEGDLLAFPRSASEGRAWHAVAIAEYFAGLGRLRLARHFLDEALALEPGSVPALRSEATLELAQGWPRSALLLCDRLTAAGADSPQLGLVRARAHLALTDSIAARAALDSLIADCPDCPSARRLRAELAFNGGDYQLTVSDLGALPRDDPAGADALCMKGEALHRLGRVDEALASWYDAVAATHQEEQYRWLLSRLQINDPDFDRRSEEIVTASADGLGAENQFIELALSFDAGYDAMQSYTGVYYDGAAYYIRVPLELTYSWANRVRISACAALAARVREFEFIRKWADLNYVQFESVYGVVAGPDRYSLGASWLIWSDPRRGGCLTLSAATHSPQPAPAYEDYLTDLDLNGVMDWEDPFWFEILSLHYRTRLSLRAAFVAHASTRMLFGIEPDEHMASATSETSGVQTARWGSYPEDRNWMLGAGLRFYIPGDEASATAIKADVLFTRTGTNYGTDSGLLYRLPARRDTRFLFGYEVVEDDSRLMFQVGLNFTQHDATWGNRSGTEKSLVILGTRDFRFGILDAWF